MQAPSSADVDPHSDGGNARLTGESAYKPVNHRAGKAGCHRLYPRFSRSLRKSFAREPRVHAATRPSLRPLLFLEGG